MARSECCSCKQRFSSEYSFNKHRKGSYGAGITSSSGVTNYSRHERRCLSELEMLAKGLVKNERGIWTTGTFDSSVFKKKEGTQ